MMPWSGHSLTSVKHAYEMGTLGLHLTSIILAADALTTNRSMCPKDLNWKPTERREGQKKTMWPALADKFDCEKSLDWESPVTEVLTLRKGSGQL
jgi:hypothetical protein